MVIKARLLAVRNDHYTNYVFENLTEGGFIMCTRLPNWQTPNVEIGDIGFLDYNYIKAGDTYYNPTTNTNDKYRYTNNYFINFVKEEKNIKKDSIIL